MVNRAMCYYMKEHGIFQAEVEDVMDVYTKQCAIEMNSLDLAKIGSVFALNGKHPETGEQIIPKDIARICKTFMVTCGMYNASGEFAIKIGIPAKSGVSGASWGYPHTVSASASSGLRSMKRETALPESGF